MQVAPKTLKSIALTCAIFSGGLVFPTQATEYQQFALLKESETTFREFRVEPPKNKAIVIIIEQELDQFLKLAARRNGFDLRFSGEVDGILRNTSLPMDLLQLLPRLSARFDLSWRMEGHQLFVSRASERRTKTLILDGIATETFRAAMQTIDAKGEKLEYTLLQDGKAAKLIGTPSYVDAALQLAERLRK